MRALAEIFRGRAARCSFSIILAVGVCAFTAPPVLAESGAGDSESPVDTGPDLTSKVVDATLLRPLGLLSTVAGAGFFVASLPITIAAEQVGTAREVLVETPYENTFERPLGRI